MLQEMLKMLPFGSDASSTPSKHILAQNAVFLGYTGHYKLYVVFWTDSIDFIVYAAPQDETTQ
jgi:hypothetical protein